MARPMSPRGFPSYYPRSTSPAPAQLPNKRERKQKQLSDKLEAMKESFEGAHQEHFYAQLSAIHCDINLMMQANPYQGPLDDSPEEIAHLVNEARSVVCPRPIAPEAEKSFENLSGRQYARYVEDVNNALEQRDADLTQAFNNYHLGMAELKRAHSYRTQLAVSEHDLLTRTLRERLVQSVSQKKARLLKDKEQLDIADSNALLLNPTQFSIGNPANSPGGLAGYPRKTRNTRGRPGEGDEPAALSNAEANGNGNGGSSKRKRKAAAHDEDSGSPGPPERSSRNGNGSNNTNGHASRAPGAVIADDASINGPAQPQPMPTTTTTTTQRDINPKSRAAYAQFEAPLYSIERLFSEKELLMTMNRAHMAAGEHFERLRTRGLAGNGISKPMANNGISSANGTGYTHDQLDGTDGVTYGNADTINDDTNGPATTRTSRAPTPLPSAPTHATRATLRSALPNPSHLNPTNPQAAPPSALESLASLTLSNPSANIASTLPASTLNTSTNPYMTVLPPYAIGLTTTASASKANPAAPPPMGASDGEIADDVRRMREGIGGSGYRKLADRCCARGGVGGKVGDGIVVGSRVVSDERSRELGRRISDDASREENEEAKEDAEDVVMDDTAGHEDGVDALGISGIGGGVAMSKESSGAGFGGEGMSRTASARGGGGV